MDTRRVGIALAALFASSAAFAADAGLESAPGLNKGQPEQRTEVAPGHGMQPQKGAGYGANADAYEYGFQYLDTNHNGYISRDEAQALVDRYDRLDQNSDNRLDRSEFAAFGQQQGGQGASGGQGQPNAAGDQSASGSSGGSDKPYGDVTDQKPANALGTDPTQ